jgi:hypothetical protein
LHPAVPTRYISSMQAHSRAIPLVLDMVDDQMAEVLRTKTGAERLQIASGMFVSASRMLVSHLRAQHTDWDDDRVRREAARRLSHGTA